MSLPTQLKIMQMNTKFSYFASDYYRIGHSPVKRIRQAFINTTGKNNAMNGQQRLFHQDRKLTAISNRILPVYQDRAGNIYCSIFLRDRTRIAQKRYLVSDKKTTQTIGPYGLRRVDYSQPPPLWFTPPQPPPEPNSIRPYIRYFMVCSFVAGLVYVYFNQDEDMIKYWGQLERGITPVEYGRPDPDDDGDDDEEDEGYNEDDE